MDLEEGGSQTVEAKNVVVATGSEPSVLPPLPVDNDGGLIVDSTGAIALKEVPKKMAVIGGGIIGLELGSVWRRLGADVTVIEFLDRICPGVRAGASERVCVGGVGQPSASPPPPADCVRTCRWTLSSPRSSSASSRSRG